MTYGTLKCQNKIRNLRFWKLQKQRKTKKNTTHFWLGTQESNANILSLSPGSSSSIHYI